MDKCNPWAGTKSPKLKEATEVPGDAWARKLHGKFFGTRGRRQKILVFEGPKPKP